MSQSDFSELKTKIDNWDIEAEEMLLNKVQAFTNDYIEQFNQFCKNLDSLDIHLTNCKVENYKAISQLKILSNNQFIEEILEENIDQETKETRTETTETSGTPGASTPGQINNIIINDIDSQKEAFNISIQALQTIQSKKDKEQIEDDTVSVSSSKLNLDNFKKYVRLPYIIGTEDFEKDKTIGLTIKVEGDEEEDKKQNEENGSEDSEVEEFVSDIKVDEQRRKKWEKVKKKKKKKKEREREKEREKERRKESEKILEQKQEFEEDKVKVPIENEVEENNFKKEIKNDFVIIESSNSKNVPISPPPPPPPPPKIETTSLPIQNQNLKEPKTETNNNITNIPLNNNEIKNNIIQPKIENNNNVPIQKPVDEISTGNKPTFSNVKLSNFLGGIDAFPDDEEDDDDGLFSRKNRIIPVIPNQISNQNNDIQIQKSIPSQNQMPPITQIKQIPQMDQIPQLSQISKNPNIPSNIETNTQASKVLGFTKKKLSNMFGEDSDDDDDMEIKTKPQNIEKKNDEIPLESNPTKLEEEKKNEIIEEKKEEEKKVEEKKVEEKKEIKNDIFENKLNIKTTTNFVKKESGKDKMVNSLFDLPEEDEKKNTNDAPEVKEPEKQKIENDKKQSQKRLAFLFDDDD